MNDLLVIDDREQAKRQQITDSYLTDVENFRSEATVAFKNLSSSERALLKGLETTEMTSYTVLAMWNNKLRPLLNELHAQKSDESFKKSMSKHLIMNESQTADKIDYLVKARRAEVFEDFIYDLYPISKDDQSDKISNQRENARNLLSLPEVKIEQIMNRQIDYILYEDTALKNGVSVVDAHSGFLRRFITATRVRSEQKKAIVAEDARLAFISSRLDEIMGMNDGLIGQILAKKWDLIVILGMRNQYEKKVGELAKDKANNAIKRLAIYDKETMDFRNEQSEKLVVSAEQSSLQTTRHITEEIDNLLLRIFDLTTIQKNQLLLQTKEYRELVAEQTTILRKRQRLSLD